MKPLAILLVAAALLYGAYYFYMRQMPSTDQGTAATQAISLTGVRMDLIQLAQAERGNMATNGHCSPIDELLSSGGLSMSKPERDGYSYVIDCKNEDFEITASHAPAPAGSPIRYPTLVIDNSGTIREVAP